MAEKIRLTQFSKGGGCGCKIAPSILQEILQTQYPTSYADLLVGNETADDAAVYRINDNKAIISTTDFFLPIVDDPFDFGRIAAANAISDVYAMGGEPLMAIAILGFPIDKLPVETARRILDGGRFVCNEANIPLAGGHTIETQEPVFGLSVTGSVFAEQLKRNNGAKGGDFLFLTKPIGSGILSTALKREQLKEEHYEELLMNMTKLNNIGTALGKIGHVHALTDVTGFGLLGHAIEMAEASNVGLELRYSSIQKMTGIEYYLQHRTIPDATYRNWNTYNKKLSFEKGVNVMEAFNLLPDPQTNGGLLVAIAPEGIDELKSVFLKYGLQNHSEPIGICTRRQDKTILVRN